MKLLALALLLAMPGAVSAAPLTVRTGESWIFAVKNGQPVAARRVAADAKPGPGQLAVTVRALMGTTMFVTNRGRTGYTVRAELLRGAKAVTARACTIPPTGKPVMESWTEKADAVRLSDFRPSTAAGCP